MTIFQCRCYEMVLIYFGQYDIADLQHLPSWFPCQRVNINRALVGAVVNQLDRYLFIILSNMLTRGKGHVAEVIYPRRKCCKGTCMFAISITLVCHLSTIHENMKHASFPKIFPNVGK